MGDVMGVQAIDEAMIPATSEEYIKVKRIHPSTTSFRIHQLLPRPVYALQVKAAEEADAPILFLNPIGRVYAPPRGESDYPALIVHTCGRGRTAYFPYLLGDHYAKYKIYEHQKLLTDTVRWAMSRPSIIEISAPPTVVLELRSQSHPPRKLIHLINTTGDMQRPLTELIPITDIALLLRCDRPSRIHALWSGDELPFEQKNGTIRCVLPRLDLYEVIVVE